MNDVANGRGVPLRLDKITRIYRQAGKELVVFRDVSLTLRMGEIVALVGQSGAGKSSLLHIAGLLEAPSSGEVYVGGEAASALPERGRTEIRRRALGFVYQFHHLLPEFTALENVAMPRRIAGEASDAAAAEAKRLLGLVGLSERMEHRPSQLSGGEQQRVAIARALANRPRVLLADEPTGNLDPTTAEGVFQMLISIVRVEGLSALVATHNHALSGKMDRTLVLEKGRLVETAAHRRTD
jgi:lipoprotein-releasing system ATP-binding protein